MDPFGSGFADHRLYHLASDRTAGPLTRPRTTGTLTVSEQVSLLCLGAMGQQVFLTGFVPLCGRSLFDVHAF